MRISGPHKLVKRAEFCARLFDINPDVLMVWGDEEDDCSFCTEHEDGSFQISVVPDTDGRELITTIGHEMVHVWQHVRGDLKTIPNELRWIWKGQMFSRKEGDEEAYYLCPWEMEARALEDWIEYRWRNRKNVLH